MTSALLLNEKLFNEKKDCNKFKLKFHLQFLVNFNVVSLTFLLQKINNEVVHHLVADFYIFN